MALLLHLSLIIQPLSSSPTLTKEMCPGYDTETASNLEFWSSVECFAPFIIIASKSPLTQSSSTC